MAAAFQFCSSVKLVELTGRRAGNLDQLLGGIRELDLSVVFHHTHHFLLQHQYLLHEPPSDFAWWVSEILQERALGEELGAISTVEFKSLSELRDRIVATIEGGRTRRSRSAEAPPGLEFNFLRAHSYVFPTERRAESLGEFATHLRQVSLNSIYHHIFEARLRLERPTNDFALWFRGSLGEEELAASVEHLDPYVYSLDDLRKRIVQLVSRKV